jgi:hypothetical protein
MVPLFSRQQVFEKSMIADLEIASRQKFYFAQFEGEDPAIIAEVIPIYDHLTTLTSNEKEADRFCVLAYDEQIAGNDYTVGFANAFSTFLTYLGIKEIILIQDLCNDWKTFGFDKEQDKVAFFELTGKDISHQGLLLNQSLLSLILPLLYHNNPDQGDCSFYTLNDDLPIGMLYWKSNIHISCFEKDMNQIMDAAGKAKLVLGGREIAIAYYFGKKF